MRGDGKRTLAEMNKLLRSSGTLKKDVPLLKHAYFSNIYAFKCTNRIYSSHLFLAAAGPFVPTVPSNFDTL